VAVNQVVGEVEVKRLVPELALRLRGQDPLANARQRR